MDQHSVDVRRFAIRFDPAYRLLSTALLLSPANSYVAIAHGEVHVRMGWAFRARFARTAVTRVERLERRLLSRGVHGFAGRWLVNGSGAEILVLHLLPVQRGYVMGVPVRLLELMISVEDLDSVRIALRSNMA